MITKQEQDELAVMVAEEVFPEASPPLPGAFTNRQGITPHPFDPRSAATAPTLASRHSAPSSYSATLAKALIQNDELEFALVRVFNALENGVPEIAKEIAFKAIRERRPQPKHA